MGAWNDWQSECNTLYKWGNRLCKSAYCKFPLYKSDRHDLFIEPMQWQTRAVHDDEREHGATRGHEQVMKHFDTKLLHYACRAM
jgi:hypothetical protein